MGHISQVWIFAHKFYFPEIGTILAVGDELIGHVEVTILTPVIPPAVRYDNLLLSVIIANSCDCMGTYTYLLFRWHFHYTKCCSIIWIKTREDLKSKDKRETCFQAGTQLVYILENTLILAYYVTLLELWSSTVVEVYCTISWCCTANMGDFYETPIHLPSHMLAEVFLGIRHSCWEISQCHGAKKQPRRLEVVQSLPFEIQTKCCSNYICRAATEFTLIIHLWDKFPQVNIGIYRYLFGSELDFVVSVVRFILQCAEIAAIVEHYNWSIQLGETWSGIELPG